MVPTQVRTLLDLLSDALVAGGAVRDALMGVEPKDWDVATSMLPEAVMEAATAAGFTVVPTGLKHGTVTVVVDGMPLEVTTLRKDVTTDGRHAEVEFVTSWETDGARRDLTMNAMFMDAEGFVNDMFGGADDLAAGTVRFVGHAAERLEEDYLRILRFFRFAGRMEVEHFDPEAMRAVARLSPNLSKVSGERVWMEMSKILTGPMLFEVLDRMRYSGVLSAVNVNSADVDKAVHVQVMGGSVVTVLAALAGTPDDALRVADTWKLSLKERYTLMHVATHADTAHTLTLSDWKKRAVLDGKELTLEVMCLTSRRKWMDTLAKWTVPVFPLTGADILILGVKPGPEVGRKLRAAKALWLDSNFRLGKRKLLQLAATV
jgi:tRNA nucleotidyltransferase/poly(A) polymerase